MSSKIFNSDRALLDLIYNNTKFTDNDDNILLRDLIPEGENNAVLTVQVNKNINNNISRNISKKQKNRDYYSSACHYNVGLLVVDMLITI